MFNDLWENIVWFLYTIVKGILKIIDTILEVFMVLAGIKPVTSQDDAEAEELVATLLKSDLVRNAYITIAVIAVVLLVIVVSYASIKQDIKPSKEDVSKGALIRKGLMSIVAVLIVPTFLLICLRLVQAITTATVGAISGGETLSIGALVFDSTMYLQAGKDITVLETMAQVQFGDKALIYQLPTSVLKGYYDIDQWEVVLAFLMGGILAYVFLLVGLNLVERIFSIIVLYLFAPFVAAVSPLDDGARHNIWKETIASKVLSAGGTIIAMTVYMMIISSGIIKDFNFGTPFMNTIGQFLLIIGGALVASKGGLLVAQLIGHGAGAAEAASQANSFRSLMGGTMRTGRAIGQMLFGSRQARMFSSGRNSGGGGGSGSGKENGSKNLAQAMGRVAHIVRNYGVVGAAAGGAAKLTGSTIGRLAPANNLRNVMRARKENAKERKMGVKQNRESVNRAKVDDKKQAYVQKDAGKLQQNFSRNTEKMLKGSVGFKRNPLGLTKRKDKKRK